MGRSNYPEGRREAEGMSRTEAERQAQEALKNQVKRSVAEINWEYAVVQRMNPEDLSTQLLPFNLGKSHCRQREPKPAAPGWGCGHNLLPVRYAGPNWAAEQVRTARRRI